MASDAVASAAAMDPGMNAAGPRGAFPLLCTPWTADAELDVPVLVAEAEFVDRCGASGVVWPTAGEVLGNLSDDEYRAGLEALAARAAKPDFAATLTAICPGATSADAVRRGAFVEGLAKRTGAKMSILARPPDDARTQADIEAHYRAFAAAVSCPVIIQTYNGKSPQPDVELLEKLAREFPKVYGWVKEESPGNKVNARLARLAASPAIKTVFSGWGAKGLLHQGPRLGARGVITQRPAYADLLAYIMRRIDAGADSSDPSLARAYADYLLMINLGDVFADSGDAMRGPHLYALERRGVFKNRLTRIKAPKNDPAGRKWIMRDVKLTSAEMAEIDARLARLAQYAPKDGRGAPRVDEAIAVACAGPKWCPTKNKKVRAVLWGVVHNHARGKFDAMIRLKNDYEIVGWVDDTASTAMRMVDPNPAYCKPYPKLTPSQVFDEVKPDVIVIEVSNSELVGVARQCADRGYPMHMDKPLGTSLAAFREVSDICRARGIPLQTGYMFRANKAIQFAVEAARGGLLGEVFAIDADLNHSYGGKKYPEYASAYPAGTVYLLACHVIEYALPMMKDEMPIACRSIVKEAPGSPVGTPNNTLTIMEWPRATCTIRVCSKGTQPRRHLRIDGTDGTLEIEPIEDFTKVKHDTGGVAAAKDDKNIRVKLFLKVDKPGYKKGMNVIDFGVFEDRYEGQLEELAKIVRGEMPNPVALYDHDLRVHKVSLQACNLSVE